MMPCIQNVLKLRDFKYVYDLISYLLIDLFILSIFTLWKVPDI